MRLQHHAGRRTVIAVRGQLWEHFQDLSLRPSGCRVQRLLTGVEAFGWRILGKDDLMLIKQED